MKAIERGVSPGVGHMQSCPDNCAGEYIKGMWIHSKTCCWAPALWKAHGKTAKDWHCAFDCEPTEIPSGWVHYYACPFWDYTETTPFSVPAPKS